MSLFKTREWWSTVVGEDEEFDTGCLCTGNIDNSNSGYGKYYKLSTIENSCQVVFSHSIEAGIADTISSFN